MASKFTTKIGKPKPVGAKVFETVLVQDKGWTEGVHEWVVLRPLLWLKRALLPYLTSATLVYMSFVLAVNFPFFYLTTQLLPAFSNQLCVSFSFSLSVSLCLSLSVTPSRQRLTGLSVGGRSSVPRAMRPPSRRSFASSSFPSSPATTFQATSSRPAWQRRCSPCPTMCVASCSAA